MVKARVDQESTRPEQAGKADKARDQAPARKRIQLHRRMKMLTRMVSMLLTVMLLAFSAPLYADTHTLPLSAEEEADLLFMREEEKLARDTYLTLYELWDLSVFSNIASSEQQHMDALLKLLKKYNLPDPAANTEIGEFTNEDLQALYDFLIDKGEESGMEALMVGGIIEETDMRDIKAAIERSQKEDIDAVYESLLCGSRNHLRSFASNIEVLTGQPYVAQVLDQTEVDEILDSPMEKCGKTAPPVKDECKGTRGKKGKCRGRMK